MHAYAEKAMREAARSTGWIDPDEAFERTVHEAVDRAYDDATVHAPLAAFVERITPYGWTNSLSQKLVQLTMPGVPDVYQGTELWEDSLVDPDNRRPLDSDLRRTLLDRLDAASDPPVIGPDGAAKLWVVSRTLAAAPGLARPVRRLHPAAAQRARRPSTSSRSTAAGWSPWRPGCPSVSNAPAVGATRRSTSAGRRPTSSRARRRAQVRLADLLASYPVALLVR